MSIHLSVRLHVALATAAMLCVAAPAFAQLDPLSTTAGLKAACETRPGNVVALANSITVSVGYPAGYPEQVASGCTIALSNGAEIQFDKVGLAFAGPLVITGGTKSGLAMQEASLAAPAVRLTFSGEEGFLKTSFSRIDATAGDLLLTLPGTSKMELFNYRTGGAPLTRATLAASGALTITTGAKLSASMVEVGLVSGGDLGFTSNSFESEFKFENSGLLSFNGNATLRMNGSKSKFEFSNASLRAPAGNLTMLTAFNESSISLSNVAVEAGASLRVDGQGTLSSVEVSNGSMVAGGTLVVAAAATLGTSSLKIDNGGYRAGTPIRFISGPNGKTGVYGAAVTGSGLVEVSTGAGGACEALGLRVTAPSPSLCQ
jgi:hypothetical protein